MLEMIIEGWLAIYVLGIPAWAWFVVLPVVFWTLMTIGILILNKVDNTSANNQSGHTTYKPERKPERPVTYQPKQETTYKPEPKLKPVPCAYRTPDGRMTIDKSGQFVVKKDYIPQVVEEF